MDQGDLLPAFLVARKLGVSRQLVYWWVKAGKLHPAGEAEDGRALYSYRAAAVVERDTRRSPLSRRRAVPSDPPVVTRAHARREVRARSAAA